MHWKSPGPSPAPPAFREGRLAPGIKFCGLTRPQDAKAAEALGASYLGVIFAGGPRLLTAERAREVLASSGTARRVGVFGLQSASEIGAIARAVGLDIVQLHGDPDAAAVARVRQHFAGDVWAVLRCDGATVPATTQELFEAADAIVLDAKVPGQLGGTGVTVPWRELRAVLGRVVDEAPVVLAGGLTPANVAEAVRALAPDVVDVSSGVEVAPGVKDHDRMRAFARAATGGDA